MLFQTAFSPIAFQNNAFQIYIEEEEVVTGPSEHFGGGGGQPLVTTTLSKIRRLFGLSGEITTEKKIKRDITGEVLYPILYHKQFFGSIYHKLNKYYNVNSEINVLRHYKLTLNGELHNPLIKNINLFGDVRNNISKKEDLFGEIYNNFYVDKNITGDILNKYKKDKEISGEVLNKIRIKNFISGEILIRGIEDKNIIIKALLMDDDESFLSLLVKKYKI